MTRRMIVYGLMAFGVVIVALAVLNAWNDIARMLPWTVQHRAANAEARLAPALATVTALDTVAVQAPKIREEQKEREHAVDAIQGADTPLPDGFGSDLQRVRDRKRSDHP